MKEGYLQVPNHQADNFERMAQDFCSFTFLNFMDEEPADFWSNFYYKCESETDAECLVKLANDLS